MLLWLSLSKLEPSLLIIDWWWWWWCWCVCLGDMSESYCYYCLLSSSFSSVFPFVCSFSIPCLSTYPWKSMGVTREPSFTGCSATCSWLFDAQQPAHAPMVCLLIDSLLLESYQYILVCNQCLLFWDSLSLSLSPSLKPERRLLWLFYRFIFCYYIYDLWENKEI